MITIRWTAAAALIPALALTSACDNSSTGPASEAVPGLSFDVGGGKYAAKGLPSVTAGGSVLEREFAIARADSVGGIVLIAFDRTGDEVGNLFVLQAPRSVQTFECGEAPARSCHGRYLVGVKRETVSSSTIAAADTVINPENPILVTYERVFTVIDGSLTLTQIGPDRLKASFSLTLEAADGKPDHRIVVENGSADVPYFDDPLTGAVACLLASTGIADSCSG